METKGKINLGYDPEQGEKQNGIKNGVMGNAALKLKEQEKDEDPWKATSIKKDYVPWSDLDGRGKVLRVIKYIVIIILVLGFLYFFICSLDFLSSAFKLLGGKSAGAVFRANKLFENPIACLMMGVLVTVLVQSSSTSTSIIISMVGVGDKFLSIQQAIFMVMGANIGTSVTNTIVALGQIKDKSEFRRAFAGATVHDMFNWMTVLILLPLEAATGYLFRLSQAIVKSLNLAKNAEAKKDLLKAITKPFTKVIIQVDKNAIADIAQGTDKETLLKLCCDKTAPGKCCDKYLGGLTWYDKAHVNYPATNYSSVCENVASKCVHKTFSASETQQCVSAAWGLVNGTQQFSCSNFTTLETDCLKPCNYIFRGMYPSISDEGIGAILLVISLLLLCICLFCIVKLLSTLLKGPISTVIRSFVNAEFPGKCSYFTGYLAILLGAGFTILVQSSSIFTSTLTPLVGLGIVELDRMYPLTLGSNIGTTMTGLLAALAQDIDKMEKPLQVAFCHLFFNISGIILFYPIPYLRFPIPLAKHLGTVTSNYRWFALVYLFAMFFIFPAAVFGLSVVGWEAVAGVFIPIAVVIIIIGIIKCIQAKRPQCLPAWLRNWKFLPVCCRSLQPYDSCFRNTVCRCCSTKCKGEEPVVKKDVEVDKGRPYDNAAYTVDKDEDTHL